MRKIQSCDHIMKFIKLELKKKIIITMIEYKQVNKARPCNSKVFFFFFFGNFLLQLIKYDNNELKTRFYQILSTKQGLYRVVQVSQALVLLGRVYTLQQLLDSMNNMHQVRVYLDCLRIWSLSCRVYTLQQLLDLMIPLKLSFYELTYE